MNKRSAKKSKKVPAATWTMFAKQDYAHAGIRGIAKAAGISAGGFDPYFKNKEELYLLAP